MTHPIAIVTGAERGIGAAIAQTLSAQGWSVIGIGLADGAADCAAYVTFDLAKCCDEHAFEKGCIAPLRAAAGEAPIKALVNNAAAQILSPLDDIRIEDWNRTLAVNLTAPMRLAQALVPDLRRAQGGIVNIGSVHAVATKPEFVGYATSKAALHGLTRALAVDLGKDVRVTAVAPAAIATEMLAAGFEGRERELAALEACHPAGRVGTPAEVARTVAFLLGDDMAFATGSIFYLDGGVLARLHDPV